MSKCPHCGGSGITREDSTYCKYCGTHAGTYKTAASQPTIQSLPPLEIPSYYKDKSFDLIAFSTVVQRRFRTLNRVAFDNLKNHMIQLLSMTTENKPLSKTILLQLPELYESNLYLYSLLQSIHSHNISVHNLITLTELTYLLKYKEEGMSHLLNDEYVILKVDQIPYILDDLQALAYLLNTRSSKDKITILTSPVAIANWGNIFQGLSLSSYLTIYTDSTQHYTKNMIVPVPSTGNIYFTSRG